MSVSIDDDIKEAFLAIRCTTVLVCRDTRLCHFCSCNGVKNEAHFMLDCPLYYPIRDKFSTPFEDVVLCSLKSFFQLNHQVDINFKFAISRSLLHFATLQN